MEESRPRSDDSVTSSRLQQVLILGGLGLFVVAVVLVGGFGGLFDLSGSGDGGLGSQDPVGGDGATPADADLTVTDVSVPGEVRAGDAFDVTITLENPGDDAVTEDLAVEFDGDPAYDETVEVEADGTATIDIAVETGDRSEGSYDLVVTVGDWSDATSVTLTEDTDRESAFTIDALAAPDEVDHGDPIPVEVVVENDGDESGMADLVVEFDGAEVATESRTIDAGDSTVFEHEIDSGEYAPGSYELTVTVGDEQASTTVEIAGDDDSATFEITGLDAPDEVASGESFELEVTVENVGNDGGATDLAVWFADEERVTDTVVLDGGESTELTYQIDTDGIDPGSHQLEVVIDDDDAVTIVEVVGADDSAFEIDEFEAPDEVEHGDPIVVNFTVENTGDSTGTVEVVTEFADDFERTETVTLGPGESAEFQYEIETDDYEEGAYDLVVTAGADQIEHEVEIEEDNGLF